MHDFRRPRPCCTHGCFPALEPILSPTRDLRSSKKLLPCHFHYPPPDGHSPAQNNTHDRGLLMAKLLNRTLTRSLRIALHHHTITPSHRRSITPTCYDESSNHPVLWSEDVRFRVLLFTRCSSAGLPRGRKAPLPLRLGIRQVIFATLSF
jgi:hypothetical protein